MIVKEGMQWVVKDAAGAVIGRHEDAGQAELQEKGLVADNQAKADAKAKSAKPAKSEPASEASEPAPEPTHHSGRRSR